jgi:hypothetical protein
MPLEAIRSVLRNALLSGKPLRFRYKSATARSPSWRLRYIRSVSGRYFTASQTRDGESRKYRLDRVFGVETIETWQPAIDWAIQAEAPRPAPIAPRKRFRWSTALGLAFWSAIIALGIGWYVITDHSSSACAFSTQRQFIASPGNGGGVALCNDGSYSNSSGPGTCSHRRRPLLPELMHGLRSTLESPRLSTLPREIHLQGADGRLKCPQVNGGCGIAFRNRPASSDSVRCCNRPSNADLLKLGTRREYRVWFALS